MVFNDAADVKLTGSAVSGPNKVYWNGSDGQNNKITGSVTFAPSSIQVILVGGEVHFPFLDVENNTDGMIITRTNGLVPGDNMVYFDDSNITGGAANLDGTNSQTAGHKWGTTAFSLTAFGDDKGLDTWAYILSTPLSPSASMQFQEADLEVASIIPSQNVVCMGNSQTYTVMVRNNGPSSVAGAKFSFSFPSAFSSVVVSSSVTGAGTVTAGVLSENEYTAILNLDDDAIVTFNISGVTSSVASSYNLSVQASLLRPADVADPDAVDTDTNPPASAQSECDSGPSGIGCKNMKTDVTLIKRVAVPEIELAN